MKWLVVFTIFIKLVTSQETVLEGDVYVEGIFSLFSSENSECDTINPFSVQVMEAAKWIYSQLNSNGSNFLPGLKIGLKVHKTCRSTTKAKEIAYSIAKNLDGTNQDTVAILGPQYSSEAIEISRLFSSLPDSHRLLQISHSTTAPSLTDHELYSNFFRTIPSDDIQVKTMLDFMQQVNWTYVAIIHDDDAYGREAADQLLSPSGLKYTCFPELFSVDPHLTNAQMYQQLKKNIEFLQKRTVPISGIVLIGGYRLGETVLKVINDLFRNDSDYKVPKILASEGFWSVEQERLDISNVTKGLFMATPPIRKVEEFETYWTTDLLGNLNAIVGNDFLFSVYKLLKQCNETECEPLSIEEIKLNFPQPYVVQYVVQAALSIARAIKGVYTKLNCKSIDCRAKLVNESKSSYIDILENSNETVNFDEDFGAFRLDVFKKDPPMVLNFTKESSDPAYTDPSVLTYAVYNKQTCKQNVDKLCMEEVFNYREGMNHFELKEENLRDYDPRTGKEFKVPNIKKPQCPPNFVCTDCQESSVPDYDITEGDLYIVGVAPIHGKHGAPTQCGPIKMGGFDCAEAIKFQIAHEMKNNKGKIPDAKIGSIIIDSCNDPQWVTEKIVNLHRKGILRNGKYEKVDDKIIGYVASWVSDVSIAVAEILTRLKKVQISYGSTSPRLSNRTFYPYFMRVVQNDENQGKEMLNIVKRLGSNYVQVLYSESAYGIGGMESVYKYAKNYDICIGKKVMVKEDKNDNYLSEIKADLTTPGSPKIIISFLSSFDVVDLLKTLNELKGYVIVASEAWGNRDLLDDATNLNGSITLANELPISTVFEDHMKYLRANRTLNQPWLQEYIEENFDCYFEWDMEKPSDRTQCGPEDNFNPSLEHDGFKIETWVPFAATAVQSLLYGARGALEEACGFSNTLCDNYKQNPEILINHTKTLSLPYDQISSKKVFDSNGDGKIAYNKYQIHKKENGDVEYVEFPDSSTWKWPWSVCDENNDACNRICFPERDGETAPITVEKTNSGPVIGVAVLSVIVALFIALTVFAVIAFRRKILCFKGLELKIRSCGTPNISNNDYASRDIGKKSKGNNSRTVIEDPYLTPGYLTSIPRSDGDGEIISTLSEKEENKIQRQENNYHMT